MKKLFSDIIASDIIAELSDIYTMIFISINKFPKKNHLNEG